MFDGKGRYNPCRYLWGIYPKDRGGHCAHITGAGSYPCSAKKTFFTPVCHFFLEVKPLLVSEFFLESERRLRARSNQNSDRSDREKLPTSKGGPVFSKLFRLDLTDIHWVLVEWSQNDTFLLVTLDFRCPHFRRPHPFSRPTGWKTRNKTGTNSSLFLDPSPSRSSKSEINHGGLVNVDEVLWNSRLTGTLVQHLLSCHETKQIWWFYTATYRWKNPNTFCTRKS